MNKQTHTLMAEDYLERARVGLAVALEGELPQSEQSHGAALMLAAATAAQAHATLAHLPEQTVAAMGRAKAAEDKLAQVLAIVVENLIDMATDEVAEQREQAHHFMRELDEAGIPIDRLVDERAQERGRGPHLIDAFGLRYDLHRQWVDSNGVRWEHTSAWSDMGVPMMRQERAGGPVMTLTEVIREYGPLHQLARPAHSTVKVEAPF